MKLVIAEKPSVGAAIAAVMGANEKRSGYFEGGGYLVSWCIGHLISLADAATYNEQFRKWKYDDLPIVPQEWQFIVASGKEQQFSILKDLMHRSDVTEIINAWGIWGLGGRLCCLCRNKCPRYSANKYPPA